MVVGVDPEQKGRVVEKKSEKENENDSDDAYLVDELTEAFTRSKPFGQPTYPNGQRQGWYTNFVCATMFPGAGKLEILYTFVLRTEN